MARLTMQMDVTNDAGYKYNPYPNGVHCAINRQSSDNMAGLWWQRIVIYSSARHECNFQFSVCQQRSGHL